MKWQDDGIVLSTRRHGERSLIVSILTRDHGRHLGIWRGRAQALMQPGTHVNACWQARLPEHLGMWQLEPLQDMTAYILRDPLKLLALLSVTHLLDVCVPERHTYVQLLQRFETFLQYCRQGGNLGMGPSQFMVDYCLFERDFLSEMGFGVDLSVCAATGVAQDLTHVSPRSGRAVCAAAAEPYKDRLLLLPEFLKETSENTVLWDEIYAALKLTGYFLEKHLTSASSLETRERLVAFVSNQVS